MTVKIARSVNPLLAKNDEDEWQIASGGNDGKK